MQGLAKRHFRIANREGNPTFDTLHAIILALQVPLAELMTFDAYVSSPSAGGARLGNGGLCQVAREVLSHSRNGTSLESWTLRRPPRPDCSGFITPPTAAIACSSPQNLGQHIQNLHQRVSDDSKAGLEEQARVASIAESSDRLQRVLKAH